MRLGRRGEKLGLSRNRKRWVGHGNHKKDNAANACMHAVEYHKTRDILHVKEVLGHRNINNTLIYINLEKAISKTSNDEFTVGAVDDVQEACKLLEVGFEYVAEVQGKKLFRKRK